MNPTEREQIENEVNEAVQMRRRKDAWLDDFFAQKQAQLFDQFRRASIGSSESLVNIHSASKALGALQVEVQTVIDTGKLAQEALNLDINQK